ncbi:MAG TPA: KUP/HAK/KT family potassium transporter [Candidatus Saccharimonadales bacterium]|nr:KUP/HAK/KT family potassium transporter [Candidatus Saccharimonadales bacterium]
MTKTKKLTLGLTIGALGVVFGDIGTSPLYVFQAVFGPLGQHLPINTTNIYGITSLILWAVTLVVSIKYIIFIMRADNQGEGGIMALVALIKGGGMRRRYRLFFILLGLIGMALFYGDSVITPAISVLSAVEGLKAIAPGVDHLIVPVTLAILTFLFLIQKRGTAVIGRLFGPVMLSWFATIAVGGILQIIQHPEVLSAISPLVAGNFLLSQPIIGFVVMGAVVLAVTGAEALYADMGHFGRAPISRAWFFVVFPALILCYLGQGALLLHDSTAVSNPLPLLFPELVRAPVVLLATLATLIASQSVISGAFSLTRQAAHLDFLPKMLVRHTSMREAGQIYMPFVNAILFTLVIALVVFFGSSQRLAGAFGVAVSGTLIIDSILFLVVMYTLWRRSLWVVLLATLLFIPLDILFVTSNISKIPTGGWFPVLLAAFAFLIITTWMKGQSIVGRKRRALEGSLQAFIDKVQTKKPSVIRLPGQAVYISHHPDFAPLAIHAAVDDLNELHEKVVILSVQVTTSAHVPVEERAIFDGLKYNDGISHLSLSYGFHDSINIPKTLESLRHLSPELDFNSEKAIYFISQSRVVPGKKHNLFGWRKTLYCLMARNTLSASDYYKLPIDRTIEMQSLIKL